MKQVVLGDTVDKLHKITTASVTPLRFLTPAKFQAVK